MAENKKAIIVYADWITKFEELTDVEAGKLIKHFFRYVNDLNPEAPDRTTKLMFIDIKNTLKRDLNKYQDKKTERSNAGKLGNLKKYNVDLYNKVIANKLELEEALSVADTRRHSQTIAKDSLASKSVAKLAVSVNDSVNDNVINNKAFKQIILKDSSYIEITAMQTKSNIETVKKYLETFDNHLIRTSEQKKTLKDYKTHFTHWLNLQDIKKVVVGVANPYQEQIDNIK